MKFLHQDVIIYLSDKIMPIISRTAAAVAGVRGNGSGSSGICSSSRRNTQWFGDEMGESFWALMDMFHSIPDWE